MEKAKAILSRKCNKVKSLVLNNICFCFLRVCVWGVWWKGGGERDGTKQDEQF